MVLTWWEVGPYGISEAFVTPPLSLLVSETMTGAQVAFCHEKQAPPEALIYSKQFPACFRGQFLGTRAAPLGALVHI